MHISKYFKFNLTLVVALAIMAGASLLPVALEQSWPMNHEYNSFFIRTQVYANHIQQGDWFPIWSSSDNNGLGSPQPAMYHKLFYMVSGTLYAATDLIKLSIILSIWLFLLIGSIGTYTLCRTSGCSRLLALCGACMLAMSNYTLTNWLIRGAMAEFSAAMLVPFALTIYTKFITENHNQYRTGLYLGLVFGLMFLAHSVIAFFLALLLGLTTLILVLSRKAPITRLPPKAFIIAGGTFFLITSPYLFIMFSIGHDYDLSRITPTQYWPQNNIKPLTLYLWDANWNWGHAWNSYTVQLDSPIMILLTTGLLYYFANLYTTCKIKQKHPENSLIENSLILLFLLTIFLQTKLAIPFYQYFPGARFIQFPWRLLGVLTPCLIVLSLLIWQRHSLSIARFPVLTATLAMLFFSGAWAHIRYEIMPTHSIENQPVHLKFSAFEEYVPTKARKNNYSVDRVNTDLAKMDCLLNSIHSFENIFKDPIVREFDINCPKPGTYPLPIFSSSFHRVQATRLHDGNIVQQTCGISDNHPSLCTLNLEKAGPHHIIVYMPTFLGIFQNGDI